MRGADLLVKTLAQAGVTRIFSLSGNQIMPIYNACLDAGIDIIHTRHESAAVFMADAYAQLTGQIGVALVTAGPGAANAVGPLGTARHSESPVLLLSGDSPLAQDGMGAFQELDQVPMTAPLTKLSFRATSAADLGKDTAMAIRTARAGRPGPVHMVLPFDVLQADAGKAAIPAIGTLTPNDVTITPADLAAIISEISAATRPIVICGPTLGATRTGPLLASLANAVDAPVVVMQAVRGLKDPGLGGLSQALTQADLIVCLGKPVNFMIDFGKAAPNSQWIVIDPETAELDRAAHNLGDRLKTAAHADALWAAHALIKSGGNLADRSKWRGTVAALVAARAPVPAETPAGGKISPAALVQVVQKHIAAANRSVVICDGGEFGQWAVSGTVGDLQLVNGPAGAIGGALCYGVGAKLAKPDATVFAFMGDGTVGFHFAEFETAARENTPFVVIIGNDECWNAENQIQLRDYGPQRRIGLRLSAARYDLAVAALGGHGEYVTSLADLDAAVTRAVASGKVACVNVVIKGLPAPSGPAH